MFAKGPLFVNWGSAQAPGPAHDRAHWDAAWVEGFAVAPVASVELVLSNCAVIPLQVGSDGAFLGAKLHNVVSHTGQLKPGPLPDKFK